MQWRDDTTFPSRGRPIGKSSESLRITLGFKTPKAQNEQTFSGVAPDSGPASRSLNYSLRQLLANAAMAASRVARWPRGSLASRRAVCGHLFEGGEDGHYVPNFFNGGSEATVLATTTSV